MDDVEDSSSAPISSSSSTSTASGNKGLSAAELRERRRQKILGNSSSRMSIITGAKVKDVEETRGEVEYPPEEVTDWTKLSQHVERMEEDAVEGGILRRRVVRDDEFTSMSSSSEGFNNFGEKSVTSSSTSTSSSFTTTTIKSSIINQKTKVGSPTSPKTVTFAPGTATAPSSTSTSSSSFPRSRPSPAGFMMTQADGSTLHPKLSNRACRILVMILGVCLALLNAKYFLVTFCSWEVAVLVINGFPNDEEPSSNLLLLIALLGMKEPALKRFKFALKLINCLITDFSILMVSSLTSRILFENYMGTGAVK